MKNLFITGLYRSGTTLLDKLLHGHPLMSVASQPIPTLFFHTKRAFWAGLGRSPVYPLGDLFLENAYTHTDFERFLQTYRLEDRDLNAVFDQLRDYSGAYMPEVQDLRTQVQPDRFAALLSPLWALINQKLKLSDLEYAGTKEIICEEFLPFLLDQGFFCLLVVRDPRDVVASCNYGDGSPYTGKARPILPILRNWRKSVAFAATCQGNPNFKLIQYEALVQEPALILQELCDFLNLPPFPGDTFSEGIKDQYGRSWSGNSSFGALHGRVDQGAVGKFRHFLPSDMIAYIESLCLPEFRFLGYQTHQVTRFDPETVTRFVDPFAGARQDTTGRESRSADEHINEIKRWDRLAGELSDAEKRRWFLFPATYTALKRHHSP